MNTYIVQDSDWDWDEAEGRGVIVQAETPEAAASKVCEGWAKRLGADGACVKVAELNILGFAMWDRDAGIESYTPYSGDKP